MILFKTVRVVLSAFLLISILSVVKSDISDDECGIFDDFETTTVRPRPVIKPVKDYTNRPRPDQRSLLIIFDATGSMSTDLMQLRGAAQEIINTFSSRENNPIYNYVLSIFRDPGL